MTARRWTTLTALLTATLAVGLAVAAPGQATTPSASLTPTHTKITANTKPSFSYTFTGLPRGTTNHLQRQFGTGHVWKNVAQLSGSTGTVTAPKLDLGKYAYRLAATKNGATVVTSKIRYIYSYGKITLRAFCGGMSGSHDCYTGTLQVGGTILSYSMELSGGYYPNYDQAANSNRTSCRSLTLQFAEAWEPDDDAAYIKIVQSATDPQYGQNSPATIGTMTAHLDGGPIYIDGSSSDGDPLYATGSASCYTVSGHR